MTQPILKSGAQPVVSIFDDIRAGFRFVHDRAAHVRIHQERLQSFAQELPCCLPENTLDPEHHYTGSEEDTAAYILTLDGINFGSGYKPALADEGWPMIDHSLYFTVSTRLKNFYESHGVLSAQTLAAMDIPAFSRIMGLNITRPYSAEYAALCTRSLNEIGQFISDRYDGSFLGPLEEADHSAARLVGLLSQLDSFNDIHRYKGRDVALYKRAQSTAADLNDAFRRFGRELFSDLDRLTILADNDVPHVLRMAGVLEYEPGLAHKIGAGIPLGSGSGEEIEIRGCAAYAAELIAGIKGISPIILDRILWHSSAEDARYTVLPAHRTLSRFY